MSNKINKRRVIFLPLPGGRYPCGVNGGRPTPQRTLLIYGKIEKMSRFLFPLKSLFWALTNYS